MAAQDLQSAIRTKFRTMVHVQSTAVCSTASMLLSIMPPVWVGDHICSSIIAVSHATSPEEANVGPKLPPCGRVNGFRATREDLSGSTRSMLRIPVIVDHHEISRALEMRNWVMLIVPYGSKGGSVPRSAKTFKLGTTQPHWRLIRLKMLRKLVLQRSVLIKICDGVVRGKGVL